MSHKHIRSRYTYPTNVNNGDIGHKPAKADIERTIKRQLHKDTKIKKCGGNWVFVEPKN